MSYCLKWIARAWRLLRVGANILVPQYHCRVVVTNLKFVWQYMKFTFASFQISCCDLNKEDVKFLTPCNGYQGYMHTDNIIYSYDSVFHTYILCLKWVWKCYAKLPPWNTSSIVLGDRSWVILWVAAHVNRLRHEQNGDILQMAFSNAFCLKEKNVFWFKCHWCFLLWVDW